MSDAEHGMNLATATEQSVLDKALSVLDGALEGKVIDPNAVDVAVRMTQMLWVSVYADRARERQILEAIKNKWDPTIRNPHEE